MLPWKGGVVAANAPDLIYLDDPDRDGKAARSRTLYSGFGLKNIQQLVNGLQWGLDNWVYGVAGNEGGTITSPEKKDFPALVLHGRAFLNGAPTWTRCRLCSNNGSSETRLMRLDSLGVTWLMIEVSTASLRRVIAVTSI